MDVRAEDQMAVVNMDWVLAHSPAFVASLRTADVDLGRGRAMSLEELLARNPVRRTASAAKRVRRPSAPKNL